MMIDHHDAYLQTMIADQLESANLSLRPFSIEDATAVFEYWRSDPAWERYNASLPRNFSLDDAREFVRKMRARSRATSPSWAILHQGRVVGVVSISFEQDHRIAVIGYGVHGDLRGKGLSVEATSKVINEAFEHYPGLAKIRAHLDAENAPSSRVLEKLGFLHEGTLRKNQYVKRNFVDEAIYGLLREDWETK
jgi:RimJ/RimL family protein N-acetyltransferase